MMKTGKSTAPQDGEVAGVSDAEHEEMFELALRIADGSAVDAPAGDASLQPTQGLLWVDQIARQLRRSLHAPAAEDRNVLFRFAGLDVLGKLGEGSFGEVYTAFDPMLRQDVALKFLKAGEGSSTSLLDEARSLAQLRHPNILSVYGAASEQGRVGLWTELVRGTTLADLVAAEGPLSAAEVRAIGSELCQAISYLHRRGWTHGDIKPQNIMRDDFGRVVLMDFGCVQAASWQESAILRGSVRFMAPEILRGEPRTAASDIYALGVSLFFLLSGEFPYAAPDVTGGDVEVIPSNPRLRVRVPQAPRGLCDAIERAIDLDPKRRYRTGLAFAAAIDASFGSQRTRPRVAAAVGLAAVAVALAIFVWKQTGTPKTPAYDVALYRSTPDGYAPLSDGQEIGLGEGLTLRFRSDRPAYVYVLDNDGPSTPSVLFPSASLQTKNPLPPGESVRLPGEASAGKFNDWHVDRDSAYDHVAVIASPTPVLEVEALIADWSRGELADASNEPLRGIHGLIPARALRPSEREPLNLLLRRLQPQQREGKIQYWSFTFPHAATETAEKP